MVKRTNRMAWGLVVVLAVVLLVGVGLPFALGYIEVQVFPPSPLPSEMMHSGGEGVWRVAQPYDLGICVVWITRTYHQREPPPEVVEAYGR
jgi:hypothetical protein